MALGGRGQRGAVNSSIEGWPGRLGKKLNTSATYVVAFVLSLLRGPPFKAASQSGTMPTTRAGAALAPSILSGKHATWKPVAGSSPRFTRRSIWEYGRS